MEITLENVRAIMREAFEDFKENTFKPYCKKNDEDHVEIKGKQDFTNSNVSKLQEFRARVEGAFWLLRGQWAVGIALVGLAASIYFKG